uniref:fibrous sheath CABYR-binding protein isoform X2 n=1 Tax=Ciona intestinalis TaxID=7719 RepID=UPI000EF50F14|nr:fibrous sheath CABYR-binding protein isoform X2 [Ciona intestinalis]|eukprot:XP_026689786.1 fibrous sheath CABYR-binding protein isoform X2 [Ciona intestinalis]
MGQKSSKKVDLYVTDDVTRCHLPDDDVTRYVGRAREYTAVDVIIKKPKETVPDNSEEGKKKSPVRHPPNSILRLLTGAHRKSYHLAFVVPKVKGSKPSQLGRNSLIVEENKQLDDEEASETGPMTHTVFLLRPKVKSRLKKEFSLKKMEAQKTFLNVMMDIEHHWVFSIKEFTYDVTKIASGEYVRKLQEMIDTEASKCGRLLSVMRVDDDVTTKENGTSENGVSDKSENLTLRMIYLHETGSDSNQKYNYKVECVHIKCTEKKLKRKKKAKATQPKRDTNVTWSDDWLSLVKEDTRLTEVINVGELSATTGDEPVKENKKNKLREFDVITLCFYENNITKTDNGGDDVTNEEKPVKYDGMVRIVWAPIDDNVQESLEAEAGKYGDAGWELCTVLVTSHVRMKQNGSEFRKCAIFFQRPKEEFVSEIEKGKSKENLLMDGTTEIEEAGAVQPDLLESSPPTSPKEKAERFGIAMLPVVDIGQTKLRATKPSPKAEKTERQPNALTAGIAAVQLKKVDRDVLKKSPVVQRKEEPEVVQVKLRRAEVTNIEKKEEVNEVPWMKTLEKKREAVMRSESPRKSGGRPKSGEAEGELAKKLDEMKEKRAERLKRVSIHKEEEAKRKSLQDPKKQESEEKILEVSDVDIAVNVKDATEEKLPEPIVDILSPPPSDEIISASTDTVETSATNNDALPPPPSDDVTIEDLSSRLSDDVIPPSPPTDKVILSPTPGDDVIPPPPTNDDVIAPPSDDVIPPPPPSDDVILRPPTNDDVIASPSDDVIPPPPPSDDVIPPPPTNDDVIASPSDDVIPLPPPSDDVIHPPTPSDDVILPPPPSDDAIPSPPTNDDVIAPPSDDVIRPPPPSDDVIHPQTPSGDVIPPPPPNDNVIGLLNDDVILPPPPSDDVILPPLLTDDVVPLPDDVIVSTPNDALPPPPQDDVIQTVGDEAVSPNDEIPASTDSQLPLPIIDDAIIPQKDDATTHSTDDVSISSPAKVSEVNSIPKDRSDISPLSILNLPPPPADDNEEDNSPQRTSQLDDPAAIDNKVTSAEAPDEVQKPDRPLSSSDPPSASIDEVLASFDFVYQDVSSGNLSTLSANGSTQTADISNSPKQADVKINEEEEVKKEVEVDEPLKKAISTEDILDEITKSLDEDLALLSGTETNNEKLSENNPDTGLSINNNSNNNNNNIFHLHKSETCSLQTDATVSMDNINKTWN